jgi:hypothetical protein
MQSGIGSGWAGFRRFCKEQRARLVYVSINGFVGGDARAAPEEWRPARKSPGT